ncbi:hypothetical protein GCM10027445_67810 [Amycolatopsis endophytica]|uniref:hypothetical protein n=1 Tax=Amycolatopsis endophytica TaxID=860233 RepID=UPI001C54090C|nr:hypothetical protein [Amycolatopsis endophytica]
MRLLSLGAGVQSTTVLLLACEGIIPRFDVALFADTGWEPRAVYANLERLRVHAERAGIPVQRVSAGNIRTDALDPMHRFVSMPLHTLNPDGSRGLARRQCTSEYKITPLKKAARELLGYPHPRRVPSGVFAEQAIGISTDEIGRARDSGVRFIHNIFPLLDLGFDRARCVEYLRERGFGATVKSACIGCPFHGNAGWRWIRDHDPDGWEQAVEFDRAIRHGYPHASKHGQLLRGQYFLHRSCKPLDEVDLDTPARHPQLIPTPATLDEEGAAPPGHAAPALRSANQTPREPPALRHEWEYFHDHRRRAERHLKSEGGRHCHISCFVSDRRACPFRRPGHRRRR